MEHITVIHRQDDAFAVLIRDHVIQVDQPYSAGGQDGGPSPLELFVASLAACAAHYARRYLARQGLPAEGLEVGASFTMNAGPPARVARVRLTIVPPIGLSRAHAEGLYAAVNRCTVHNSLRQPPAVDLEIEGLSQVA